MKQILQFIGVTLTILMSFLTASSYDFEVDGIYYNIRSVTRFTCEVTSSPNKYTGIVKIPSTVSYKSKDLTVVAIDSKAFEDCADLESVEIPETVTDIYDFAFKGCGFETFEIPNSIPEDGLWEGIFKDCKNLISFNWPDRFTAIPASTFEGCSNLRTITIPSSVTKIRAGAFKDCAKLNIELSDSIEYIGEEAFMGCKSLKSMLMPKVKTIKTDAFSGCIELKEVGVAADVNATCKMDHPVNPDNDDKVGHIFKGCPNLHKFIVYPMIFKEDDSITSILYRTCHEWIGDISIQELDLQSEYISKSQHIRHDKNTTYFYMYDNSIETIKLNYSKLFIGYGTTKNINWDYRWQLDFSGCKNLKCIILCNERAYAGDPIYTFTRSHYINTIVYVPDEAYETYAQTDPWERFWNLKRMSEYSGTHDITMTVDPSRTIVNRYDLNGRLVSDNYKGVVIVVFSDGTTKKVVQN